MDEVIQLFNKKNVRYIVIGGQALRLEGMPRFSMDWDLFIPSQDAGNLKLINRLLGSELDTPVLPLGRHGENFVQTYQTRYGVLQFHLGGPTLPAYDDAEKRAVIRHSETGTPVRCLSGNDLLESKKKSGRPQDLLDARFLEKKKQAGLL